MQPVDLAPLAASVGQQRQHDVERVEHDAPGLDLLGLDCEARQHAAEIEVSRLHEVRLRLGVDEEQLLRRNSASFQPKLSAFAWMRFEVSSKATKMPGSS